MGIPFTVYNDRNVAADGVFPSDLLHDSANYRPEGQGILPKCGVEAPISGPGLVRAGDSDVYVLEDNLRVPLGVSYLLENRGVANRTFPELFERHRVRPVDGYTDELNKNCCPRWPRTLHEYCRASMSFWQTSRTSARRTGSHWWRSWEATRRSKRTATARSPRNALSDVSWCPTRSTRTASTRPSSRVALTSEPVERSCRARPGGPSPIRGVVIGRPRRRRSVCRSTRPALPSFLPAIS